MEGTDELLNGDCEGDGVCSEVFVFKVRKICLKVDFLLKLLKKTDEFRYKNC